MKYFVRTLQKIFFFRKRNKSVKYDLFRIIIICSPPQKICMFYVLENKENSF